MASRLPLAEQAIVSPDKVLYYLLSETHPIGKHKARVFTQYGFSRENWEVLAATLRQHALDNPLVQTDSTPYGTRYVVEGTIDTPSGRPLLLRTVWFSETPSNPPRLVTAYPLRKRYN